MDYHICVFLGNLHKSDFPLQNTQKDVFCNELSHLCNLRSLTQIEFSIAKTFKRCVLQWVFTFVQVKVRSNNYKKLILYCKNYNKTCFVMEYHICVISSQSRLLLNSDFPSKNTQEDVFCNDLSHLCTL